MNGSHSPVHNNVDLSTLSKEDLLRLVAEQNNIIKTKDKIIAERGKAIDKLLEDGKRLICIGKIMNEGLTALKENFAASDKYVILLNDMLSRDTVAKAAFLLPKP